MKTQELTIEGMHCGHCVMAVRKELSKLANVNVQDVQIGRATVKIDETKVTRDSISHAIGDAGYRLVAVE